MELTLILIVAVVLTALIFGYMWCVSWAVSDAQRRGKGGGLVVLLLCLFGPLAALVWLGVRPSQSLAERTPDDYDNPDDALAAATRLDALGDWDR